jgi:cytochrome c oxidase subunit 4
MSEQAPQSAALSSHDGHHAHAEHGLAKYIYVFFALCFLTTLSFWTFSDFPFRWPFHDQPMVGRLFMMAVSCCNALLVILFFMHVKYEANWKYVLTIPAGLMSIFLMLMLIPDIGNRGHHASQERKLHQGDPHEAQEIFNLNEPEH